MKAIFPRNGMAATHRPARKWRFLVAFVPVFVFAALVSTVAVAQVTDCTLLTFTEQLGTLPDGTPYGLRKPIDWNGVLINDLDYLPNRDSQRNCYWLGKDMRSRARNAIRCAPSSTTRRRRSKIS